MKADSVFIMGRCATYSRGLFFILLVLLGLTFLPSTSSRADKLATPPGPDRVSTINVDYTAYDWLMATWIKNKVVCSLTVDHDGQPTLGEVYINCDQSVYDNWKKQKPCFDNSCDGYYIYIVRTHQSKKEMAVKLPPATIGVSLKDCAPISRLNTSICETTPILVLKGQEPLPNEHITRIEGMMDGAAFSCDPTCQLSLSPTAATGVKLSFWAWSSYGDSSPVFIAQVRVALTDQGNPDQNSWYVDVLSSQWQGVQAASCSESWGSFPPVGGPPAWLSTPQNASDLSSNIPYNYLSANLILQGVVNASSCPDGGLLPDGGANQCGLEAARSAVDDWQNQFDSLILKTSQSTGVPAQLLKNLFARESQFWPGVFKASQDAGLGQLTENGADTALLWNPSFYSQYCPLMLSADACSKGYLHLKDVDQKLLQQALVGSVNATCDNCPLGIDLSQANFSVDVFAHTLLASCEQTGQVIQNNTGQLPGNAASYEDLWKFTLANYNAGSGCLGLALNETSNTGKKITWDNVSSHFTSICSPAKDYVNSIGK